MSWSFHENPGHEGPRHRGRHVRRLAGSAALVALVVHGQLAAGTVSTALAADAGVLIHSNPFLGRGNNLDAIVIEASLSPSVTLAGADGSSFDLGGTVSVRDYSRDYGRFVIGDVRATGSVRPSGQLTVRGSAAYERDIAADTLTAAVDAAADPRSVRNGILGDVSLEWRPSARDTLTPRFSLTRTSFDRSSVLQSTRSIVGDIAYARRISPRTAFGVRATTSRRTAAASRFSAIGLFATFDRRLTSTVRLHAEAGAERTRNDRGASLDPGGRDRTMFSGTGQLCREAGRTDACLTAAITTDISALGTLQRQYSVGATATRRIGPRSTVGIVADYRKSNVQQGTGGVDQSAAQMLATLDWQIARSLSLGGQAGYRTSDVGGGGDTAKNAYAGISLRWRR